LFAAVNEASNFGSILEGAAWDVIVVRLVRLTEILDIIRDWPATRAGAARQKGKRGKAGGDAPTRARSFAAI